MVVDHDPVSPHRDADRLQAEVVHARPAAGGDDECLAAHLAAIVELDDPGGAVQADPALLRSEDESNTVRLELCPDQLPHLGILAPEQLLRPVDVRHPASRSGRASDPARSDRAAADEVGAAIDGISGSEPVARRMWSDPSRRPSTSTRPGPASRPVGALTSNELPLDERYSQPGVGEDPGRNLSGWPGAEHDGVEPLGPPALKLGGAHAAQQERWATSRSKV